MTREQVYREALERVAAPDRGRCQGCLSTPENCDIGDRMRFQEAGRCPGAIIRRAIVVADEIPPLKAQLLTPGSLAEAIYIAVNRDAETLVRVSDALEAHQKLPR